jgi:hypothetical protein
LSTWLAILLFGGLWVDWKAGLVQEHENSEKTDHAGTEHGAGNDVSNVNDVTDGGRIPSHINLLFG